MITLAQLDDGRWEATCSDCAWRFIQARHTKTRHRCKATGETILYIPADWEQRSRVEKSPYLEPTGPTFLQKVANFTRAAAEHIADNRRLATDEQVAERFELCRTCPLFIAIDDQSGKCDHQSCGCSIKAVGLSGKNKLRWASSSCPLKKPRWLPV